MERVFLTIGALFAFAGVAAGAFGAHSLKSRIHPEMLLVFEVGVRYQMYHAPSMPASATGQCASAPAGKPSRIRMPRPAR
jgi:uncharacterized membrane protein YgdD (TMEM256/DUF423 family)